MTKHRVVSINELDDHLSSNSRIKSEVLSLSQEVYVPPLAPRPLAKPDYIHGKPGYGWGNKGYTSKTSPIVLHVIDGDIRIRGPYGVITVDDIAVSESLFYTSPRQASILVSKHGLGKICIENGVEYYEPAPSNEVLCLSDPCVRATSFAPKKNYGHFWLDHIGQLAAMDEFADRFPEGCCTLIPAIANSFWNETLRLIAEASIDSPKIVPVHDNQEIKVGRLYYFEGISPDYVVRIRPQYIEFTRKLALTAAKQLCNLQNSSLHDITNDKIFLSRREDSVRRNAGVDNLAEDEFGRSGFHVIHPRQLTVCEKLALMDRTKVLAGRWGSGSFNMLFARKGAVLAELQSPFNISWTIRHLTACGEQHYSCIIGSPLTPPDPLGCDQSKWSDNWSVSLPEVQELIEFLNTLCPE